jgi:hypothetical protein
LDTGKLLYHMLRRLFKEFPPDAPGDTAPGPLSVRVKLTLDARAVSNDGILHTEMMMVLLHTGAIEACQQPSAHFTLAVYHGKDDTAHMRANLTETVRELQHLRQTGVTVAGVKVVPEFVFPADMATHWAWFCAGGVHDTRFCHRCNTLRENRACIYDWYTLPPPRIGNTWTIAEAAQLVRMNVDDFVYLNVQRGSREENMLQHHVTFRHLRRLWYDAVLAAQDTASCMRQAMTVDSGSLGRDQ